MKASLLFFPHKYSGSDLHVNMATFAGMGKLCGNKVYCSDQQEEVGWSLRQEPPVKVDRWEAKIHALFLWHGTVNMSSPLRQTLRNWEKKKNKNEKTSTDPLTQTNTRHIKPESVGHCKKEFYQLFDKESGVAHNFTEGTGKWTCDLFLVYLWEAAMQTVPVVQCWSRV